ncbi:MAG: hypothetical protein HFE73_09735 [Firmicutes bacterium]|jgi:hypothetical protein|nr:hypothetical protein [Bacillota bacterium]
MRECAVKIGGEYDILVLSPEMIAPLMKRAKESDAKEFVIPGEELFPPGYMKYLVRVVSANMELEGIDIALDKIYALAVNQLRGLHIYGQKCFDQVYLDRSRGGVKFHFTVK